MELLATYVPFLRGDAAVLPFHRRKFFSIYSTELYHNGIGISDRRPSVVDFFCKRLDKLNY